MHVYSCRNVSRHLCLKKLSKYPLHQRLQGRSTPPCCRIKQDSEPDTLAAELLWAHSWFLNVSATCKQYLRNRSTQRSLCCHTATNAADQTCHLTQPLYSGTRLKKKKKKKKIHNFFWSYHFWGSNSMTFFFLPNSMSFSRFPWPVWTLQIAVTTWFNTSCSHCRQLLLSALTYFHPYWHIARYIPKLHIPKLHRLLWMYCPGHPSQREWVGTLTGKHSRHHILSAAWHGRGAWRLEELSEYGQARASQHWSPEGKEE